MFSLLYRAFIFTIDNCICICVCVFASCSPPVSECGGTRQSGARRRWLLKLDAMPARPKARKIPTTYLHSFMKTGILYMLQIHKETHAVYLHLGKGRGGVLQRLSTVLLQLVIVIVTHWIGNWPKV